MAALRKGSCGPRLRHDPGKIACVDFAASQILKFKRQFGGPVAAIILELRKPALRNAKASANFFAGKRAWALEIFFQSMAEPLDHLKVPRKRFLTYRKGADRGDTESPERKFSIR